MRILFIVHQFMPEFAAGTERVTLNLAKSAQRDGHHVEILTRSLRPEASWMPADGHGLRFAAVEGVPVYALPAFAESRLGELGFKPDPATASACERFLQARGPFDLVHVTHPMRMLDVIGVVTAFGIPYVITLTDFYLACWRTNLIRSNDSLCAGPAGGSACIRHCSTLQLDDTVLLRRRERMAALLQGAAAVVACSEYVAGVFRAEFPEVEVRVIHHGIDLLRFGAPAKTRPSETIVFGYVGTLSATKGVHILAEAFARAAPDNAVLKLIGPAFDEAFSYNLAEIGRCGSISIDPPISAAEIPAALAQFDVLCLPSTVPETFSLAVHEGFAAGLPCLVSDLGYPAQLVREHGCGDVAKRGDVSAWSQTIGKLASTPGKLAEWRSNIPSVYRTEEEGFLYSQIYSSLIRRPVSDRNSAPLA